MKSLETLFVEALDQMDPKQKERFFTERDNLKQNGKLPALEVQLNLAKSISGKVVESLRESTPIVRNNGSGAVQESSRMTDIRERQAKAYAKLGFSEVEAEIAAGIHDAKFRKGLLEGKSTREVVESIKESAAPEKNLSERQQRAMNLLSRK